MKRIFIPILISALFLVYGKNFSVDFLKISEEETEINFKIADLKIEPVEINGNVFNRIIFEGGAVTNKKGYAEIPFLNAALQIGNENDLIVSFADGEYSEIKLEHPLLPSRGTIYRNQDPDEIPYEIYPESLADTFYPDVQVENTEPFIFRDVRGVNIYAYPVQYNSARGILRIYKNLRINLKKDMSKSTNALKLISGRIDKTMNGIYRSLFINYNETKFTNQIGENGEILVIYTPRDSEVIQPYINWKREKGFKVNTLEVATGTNVKTHIQDAYLSNPEILYVQLVGDWADIKSDLGTDQNAPTDPMLGCVAGTDLYPELIIGRFSAGSALDVSTQVNKTIGYEKTPDLGATWYGAGLGIGSEEGAGIGDDDEIDYEHIDIIKENKLLPGTYSAVNESYGSSSTASQVAAYVNAGLGVINYCGHGADTFWVTSGYSNTNINNSTNGSKLPFIFSVACVNGAFHSGTCFAEAWLRKSGGGAAAALMSSINQPWVPPMRGQDYMNDILTGGYNYSLNPGNGTSTTYADARTTFGSVSMNGCVLMLAEQYNDISTKETIQTWSVFGDASLQIRTDTPELIENTNETIFPELYSTKIISGGEPVEGARVTLLQGGVNYTGTTDINGEVSILHSFPDGEVILTVSGFNLETKQNNISVQPPEGPYLKVNEYSFSSNYCGETVNTTLSIKNIGLENSSNIAVNVSCASQYITMINDHYSLSMLTIGPGGVWNNDAISFVIDPLTPDQERIKFDVTITDSYTKRTYESDIYLTVASPVLEVTHSYNTPTAIQGQQQTVTFRIENKGHAPIEDLNVALDQITSFNAEISDPVLIDSIGAASYAEASFDCFYGGDIPSSSFLMFELSANSQSGYSIVYNYELVVGLTDGFESGGFTNNSWQLSGDAEWFIDSTVFFEGNYSACSGTVDHNQKSSIAADFNFIADGNISFYKKISTELGYDKLSFYIDGIFMKSWSGQSEWAKIIYDISSGSHNFKWEFSRDGSMGGGSNCVWLDNILATGISTTGIDESGEVVPSEAVLYQNYPNPFNPVTQIRFSLDKTGEVKLSVYNLNGQLVSELDNGIRSAGFHTVNFNAGKYNSGVYYYTLETGGRTITKKMLLIK